jgi:hypothetical protein
MQFDRSYHRATLAQSAGQRQPRGQVLDIHPASLRRLTDLDRHPG